MAVKNSAAKTKSISPSESHALGLSDVGFWLAIAIINLWKLLGLSSSPPGFYVDEAAISAQVICIKQTGQDFWKHSLPLFTPVLGGGYATPTYLYGQTIWTSIFGNSTYAFRSFVAVITIATCALLFDWLRKRVSIRAAQFALLFASISPWAFQFGRVAWDPPLAPFFLMLGLWLFDLRSRYVYIWGALGFALAAYSYPPCRIQVVVLLLALPGFSLREKAKVLIAFAVANIPMLVQAISDPYFTARGNMLAIWSSYSGNPFHDAGIVGQAFGFVQQFFAHFQFDFLFGSGDHNIRHSSQAFGEVSWVEGVLWVSGTLLWIASCIRAKRIILAPLFVFALIGITSGIAPAALTWESVPHALRSIGAWPFVAIASGLIAESISQKIAGFPQSSRAREMCIQGFFLATLACSSTFAGFYLYDYFENYPTRSEAWFQDDSSPLGSAYRKMTEYGAFCADIR